MKKVKSKSKFLRKLTAEKNLKKQKKELINKYLRYWEIPDIVERQIKEIDYKIELNRKEFCNQIKRVN